MHEIIAMLNVSPPTFSRDSTGPVTGMEQVVPIHLDPVRYADDGTPVAFEEVRQIGAFVYRHAASGADQIWNEQDKVWQTPPANIADLAGLRPIPMAFYPDQAQPWQTLFVAATAKDVTGDDRFQPAGTRGLPRYHLRAWARSRRGDGGEHIGLSEPSTDLMFSAVGIQQRFLIDLDPDSRFSADHVQFVLKNVMLQTAGYVDIRANPDQEVKIANCNASGTELASILLKSNGEIHLSPAADQLVVVDGPLQAQSIYHHTPTGYVLLET